MKRLIISWAMAVLVLAGFPASGAAQDDFDFILLSGALAAPKGAHQVLLKDVEEDWLETDAASCVLSGYFSGGSGLAWKNVTKNVSGATTGSYSFTTAAIPLNIGDNTITFSKNNTVLKTIVVTRNSLDINTLPTFNLTAILSGSQTTLYCTLGVDRVPGRTYTVTLYDSNQSGQLLTQVGTMLDDGNYLGASGDDILNDGIFTAKFNLTPPSPGVRHYRAQVTDSSSASGKSALGAVAVYAPPTAQQLQQATTVSTDINNTWQSLSPSATQFAGKADYLKAVSSAQDSLVAYIKAKQNALFATKGDNGVVFAFSDIPFLLIQQTIPDLFLWSTNLDGAADSAPPQAAAAMAADRAARAALPQAVSGARHPSFVKNVGPQAKAADDPNIIKSNQALFIDPWYWQHVHSTKMNDANGPWAKIIASQKPKLQTATALNGSDASADVDPHLTGTTMLDAYKTLSQYGVVVLHTHGAYWTFDTPGWLTELTNKINAITDPSVKAAMQAVLKNINDSMMKWNGKMVLLTSDSYVGTTLADIGAHPYAADISTGRLVVATDGHLLVTPWFIDKYNTSFPNSLVWLGACHSLQNDTMGSVFLKRGAGALFGFDESVYRSWNVSRGGVVLSSMLTDKKTAQQGFDEAIKNGNDDGHGTSLVLSGNGSLRFDNGLQNPNFEDPGGAGSLQSWTVSGDARAIKSMQDDSPTSGATMAVISSGLGHTTSYGSFSQSFTVPKGATTMTFSWNFYSAEFNDWCNKGFDDTFRVLINGVQVFRTSVDTLCGTGLIETDPIDDKGDCFKSGWESASVNVSGYAEQDVTLLFEVQDKGDTIYDSAVLVDNIVINATP
jgi:hypothetical protein